MKENYEKRYNSYIERYYMRLHLLSKQDYYNFQRKIFIESIYKKY